MVRSACRSEPWSPLRGFSAGGWPRTVASLGCRPLPRREPLWGATDRPGGRDGVVRAAVGTRGFGGHRARGKARGREDREWRVRDRGGSASAKTRADACTTSARATFRRRVLRPPAQEFPPPRRRERGRDGRPVSRSLRGAAPHPHGDPKSVPPQQAANGIDPERPGRSRTPALLFRTPAPHTDPSKRPPRTDLPASWCHQARDPQRCPAAGDA